jgi:hypothetical protein
MPDPTKTLVIRKSVKRPTDYKNRGSEKGGKYIMRVVTGTDKDGSPQYRYLRTQEEVEAYQGDKSSKKVTHEKQEERAKKVKNKLLAVKKDKKKEDKDPSESDDKKKKPKKDLKPALRKTKEDD